MSSCWSSIVAVLGGSANSAKVAGDTDEEGAATTLLRRGLLIGKEVAASDAESIKNLEEEVRGLERALATATTAREDADGRKREAETRAEEGEAELRAAEEEHEAGVEELLRTVEESDAKDAYIRELEQRIKIIGNIR